MMPDANQADQMAARTSHAASETDVLIFGPAYLDVVVEIDRPLIDDLRLDQSLPACARRPRHDGSILLNGPNGDRMRIALPPGAQDEAATYALAEPVLARLLGTATTRVISENYRAHHLRRQLGGMGAGYALAVNGLLCMPLGRDEIAGQVLQFLDAHRIAHEPTVIDGPSDSSLVILSSAGDKLAVGVREAMVRWRAVDADRERVAQASTLLFCGAPNALAAQLLDKRPSALVMYAPAMRNILDPDCPLVMLAPSIDYLTLNALEWEHLPDRDRIRDSIPVITVTRGDQGSRILLRSGEEIDIPAVPSTGAVDANRAGETYGATFFMTLRREAPEALRAGKVEAAVARRAGNLASRQASRQLRIREFAFPPQEG